MELSILDRIIQGELRGATLRGDWSPELPPGLAETPIVVDASSKTEVKIYHSPEKVVFGIYPPSMLPTNPMLWHPNGSLAQ
jgi:hypothetical protein